MQFDPNPLRRKYIDYMRRARDRMAYPHWSEAERLDRASFWIGQALTMIRAGEAEMASRNRRTAA